MTARHTPAIINSNALIFIKLLKDMAPRIEWQRRINNKATIAIFRLLFFELFKGHLHNKYDLVSI